MKPNFDELIIIRDEYINDIGPWSWPKNDTGCWDGPKDDWLNHHKEKYLKYVKNHQLAVTAGGACGMYPRLLSDYFEQIITFEPDYLNFECLVRNCQKPNIGKINMSLGEESRFLSLDKNYPTTVGMHTINSTATFENCRIPSISLDSLKLPFLDFLQLDCEGYEPFVLRGSIETIKKYRPVISVENGHNVENIMNELSYIKVEQSVSDSIFIFSGR